MNILVFTDSRGQHKPAGQNHQIFGEALAADPRLKVDLFLCPMKWTTTIDFLATFDAARLKAYDAVVLYTGIVDWSPRKASSAFRDLYDNPESANEDNLALNTRDYSKKIVNNKKRHFDEIFGADAMTRHFATPFAEEYEGEVTNNMYTLEMAERSLLPRLAAIPNLIFVSSNRFLKGWRGDYKKERPVNIDVTHRYSDLFSERLPRDRVIDLREWSDDDVKKYTCDNLHISAAGSEFILQRLTRVLGIGAALHPVAKSLPPGADALLPMRNPERITRAKLEPLVRSLNLAGPVATLIIGLRLDAGDPSRIENLMFVLKWLRHYYTDIFDVLLVEQDSVPRFEKTLIADMPNVRYVYLHNPQEYNRGWGYNVAVKHHCAQSDVVVLMDTDVLTGPNFLREILDCHTKFDAVSPYSHIYYTDESEAASIAKEMKTSGLVDASKIRNPVTIAGGIFIVKRRVFLALRGFEQYVGYGCEDRALDVTMLNHLDPARLRIAPFAYVHLHHPKDSGARARFQAIYAHLIENYGCKYDPKLTPFDFIHAHCQHKGREDTTRLLIRREPDFGDPDLYENPSALSINGQRSGAAAKGAVAPRAVIYPPEFQSLDGYREREIYASAPPADRDELAAFYNAFKGRRCFIIGNGPSLNRHELSWLNDEYTFGVNSFFYKTRETGFMPYFYVVEDSSVMKENIEEIRKFEAPFKFFPTNYKSLHPKAPNTYFFRMNRGFYEKSSPNFVVPRFSTDASDVLYCGQSVTYINLQLAYFMGFEEVYLIGMDFSYVIPESHKRTGDVLLSDSDDPNHFHKDYFGKGKTWKDPKLDRVAMNYRMAKLVYESTGRAVFNATVGGSLEVFPRVDYASLFGRDRGATDAMPQATFAEANRAFGEKRFADALHDYVQLAQRVPTFHVYKNSAVSAYMEAARRGVPCDAADVAYVRGLVVGL